ncbi:GvpL/GvpF family gas vesicle protein [Streptomyces catenulae]|uniref:GvpL/GvpF family gas vesicle protein n=1 Tax=Streptomyces catenulae TaxID=66875 RepID=A0ABV2YSS3_9ACTN|nr:GvpL/GvpF family gas vesicle protein [Streptomyces catenulae]
MAVYVYSVVATTHPRRLDDLPGVGDPPATLRTVGNRKLSAVISDAPEGLRPKRRDLAAHQDVQERLMADGPVLPLQFGFTAADDEAVRAVLEEHADAFAERLRAVEGCSEYHLKAAQDEDSMLRRVLAESDEARALNERIRGGADNPELPLALGELVAQEVQARQERLAASVLEALRPLAREENTSPATGNDFLNVSFLVTRDGEADFRTSVRKLATELGDDFDLRLRGPLPAYSFV